MRIPILLPQKPALQGEFCVCRLKHHRQGRSEAYEDHYPTATSPTHTGSQDSDSDTASGGKTASVKSES